MLMLMWYNRDMIDYYSLPETDLPMSMRHFRRMLKERGWKAEKLCLECQNDLILTRPDGKKLRVASSTPPTTNAFGALLANNKMMCYALLNEIGVSQPETVAVYAAEDTRPLIEKYGSIVIKPIDGSHGKGVTVGVNSVEQAEEAIAEAIAASQGLRIAIAQPQLPLEMKERRVICIDYQFVQAIERIPAHVTGDGKHTLMGLIELENRTIRAPMYKGELAYIDTGAAASFLEGRLLEVPAAGEKVRVVASCNVGQGGTARDVSAEFSPEMREMSEKIARAAELAVIGIDFYGEQVIEINGCPMLYYPTGDAAATRAIEAYVEYLARL